MDLFDLAAAVAPTNLSASVSVVKKCEHGLYRATRRPEADARGSSGGTPLHRACESGHGETALLLVSRGADIGVTNHVGETPVDVTRIRIVPGDCRSSV